ncbi:MAG: hypothetical protein K2R98_09820 [Gemmataceae bacterium]|nr:hypothetical protein [Gemmataceae bacterium]
MLGSLSPRRVRARQLRLFGCACCRRTWNLLLEQGSRRAVEVSERYADGLIGRRELAAARAATPGRGATRASDCAAKAAALSAAPRATIKTAMDIVLLVREAVSPKAGLRREQAALVRHILGNPFRRPTPMGGWPSTVEKLAEAIYFGEDCAFALHDALLEAGQPELAAHFQEKEHPKGCWALDLLLQKE